VVLLALALRLTVLLVLLAAQVALLHSVVGFLLTVAVEAILRRTWVLPVLLVRAEALVAVVPLALAEAAEQLQLQVALPLLPLQLAPLVVSAQMVVLVPLVVQVLLKLAVAQSLVVAVAGAEPTETLSPLQLLAVLLYTALAAAVVVAR
jgi:hypothetical protein